MRRSHALSASMAVAALLMGAHNAAPDVQVKGCLVERAPKSKGLFLRILPFCKPDNADFRFPVSLTFDQKSRGVSHWGCARNRKQIKRAGLGRMRSRMA